MFRRMLWYPRDFGEPVCFSRDTDLLPALELLIDMPTVHTEVATWSGSSRLRLKYRTLYCHHLTQADFGSVRDIRDYT